MASTSRFVFNDKDLDAYLLSSDVSDGITNVARRAKAVAVSNSPVESGEYVSRFFIVSLREGVTVAKKRRVAVLLANDSDHARAVEYGYHTAPSKRKKKQKDRPQGGSAGRAHRVLGKTAAMLSARKPKTNG